MFDIDIIDTIIRAKGFEPFAPTTYHLDNDVIRYHIVLLPKA